MAVMKNNSLGCAERNRAKSNRLRSAAIRIKLPRITPMPKVAAAFSGAVHFSGQRVSFGGTQMESAWQYFGQFHARLWFDDRRGSRTRKKLFTQPPQFTRGQMLNRRFNFCNRAHGKERSKFAENRKPARHEGFWGIKRGWWCRNASGFTRFRSNISRRPASPSWISAITCSGWMRRGKTDLNRASELRLKVK